MKVVNMKNRSFVGVVKFLKAAFDFFSITIKVLESIMAMNIIINTNKNGNMNISWFDSATTGFIYSVACGKGKQHDFALFKSSPILIHPESKILADSGYQGIHKYHKNVMIPLKKKKGIKRSEEDKIHNKLEAGMHNKVNIDRLQKDVDKMMSDIEELKDKIRDNKGTK